MKVRLKHRRLAQELGKSRMSQNAWAQRLGLESGHFSKLVNGRRPYPNVPTRQKLLQGFGLGFEDLFEIEVPSRQSRAGLPGNEWKTDLLCPPSGAAMRGDAQMDSLIQDIRYGLRQLLRRPGLTLAAVLTLALGIGANSVFFSLLNTAVLQPLPYHEPDRLVQIWRTQPERGLMRGRLSPADFLDWRSQDQFLSGLAAYFFTSTNWTGAERPERLSSAYASPGFLKLLGIQPFLGRRFEPSEEEPKAQRVVILSHAFWQSRYGGDANLLGKPLTLSGNSYTVVGILPRGFRFFGNAPDLWLPLVADPAARGRQFLRAVGRLAENVSLELANSGLQPMAEQLAQRFPQNNAGMGIRLASLHGEVIRNLRTPALLLQAVVAFVLLIACANVANLMLARSASREQEIAVRAALGAGKARLLRQVFTESLLLSGIGAALGLLIALRGIPLVVAYLPSGMPRLDEIRLDGWVVLFTLGLALATGLFFGSAPALRLARTDLQSSLKEGRSAPGQARHRTLKGLVVAEVTLALMLLVSAGLMMQSLAHVSQVDPGFEMSDVLAVELSLPRSSYPAPAQWTQFFDGLTARMAALPGIESAGTVLFRPLGSSYSTEAFSIEGRPAPPPNQFPSALSNRVDPGYFETMKIPLLRGRPLTEADGEDAPGVILISQKLALRYWPDQDPLGQRILLRGTVREVVGVVGDVVQGELEQGAFPHMYIPFRQAPFSRQTLVIRSASDKAALSDLVRKQVLEMDPNQPVFNVSTLEEQYSEALAGGRLIVFSVGLFSLLALLLAALGLYAVISFSASQRTHEIGVRMSLGASRWDVFRLILGGGLGLTLTGIALGLGGAALLTRLLSSLLYGVSATDPLTFGAMAGLFLLVALLALSLPARRSTRVDPLLALRCE